MPAPFQGEELGGYDRVPRVALRSTRGYTPAPLRGEMPARLTRTRVEIRRRFCHGPVPASDDDSYRPLR